MAECADKLHAAYSQHATSPHMTQVRLLLQDQIAQQNTCISKLRLLAEALAELTAASDLSMIDAGAEDRKLVSFTRARFRQLRGGHGHVLACIADIDALCASVETSNVRFKTTIDAINSLLDGLRHL
jgi:hypothetical protein